MEAKMSRSLSGLLLLIGCGVLSGGMVIASLGSEAGEPFVPVAYDRMRTIELEGSADRVCPLFEPDRRSLWIDWWDPQVLFDPQGGTKAGKVLRIETPHGKSHAILVYIHRHDPEAMSIVYSIIYQEVEIEKREIRCRAKEEGGTAVDVRTIIMGLNDYGNRAVRQHVEAGNVEKGIDLHRDAVDEYLRSGSK
jgi:hypothetical protein